LRDLCRSVKRLGIDASCAARRIAASRIWFLKSAHFPHTCRVLNFFLNREGLMTQGPNRLLDDFAKLMTDAAGVAQGARREVETAFRAQAERFLSDMDMVSREEHEAVKEMAARALDRIEELESRLAKLENGDSAEDGDA
jgi:BMFP domain-containing protein YqiC